MKFRKLAIIFATVMALSGCSGKEGKTDTSKLPSDTPYCRNIMETESGYYYNVAQTLSLRYTEKATGKDIFLCAKPECMHDGNDACTATYNNLIVSEPVLYDGYIYFLAKIHAKETMGYSLYKASPDGSSLDKVADIAEEKKPPQYNSCAGLHGRLIIHKGYAYVSYVVGCNTYMDFIQSGFAKVDIQTGETELLFKYDDYKSAETFNVYAGCGDYIFYNMDELSWLGETSECYRYNIKTGESEMLMDKDDSSKSTIVCFDDETVYYKYFDHENNVFMLKGYDAETFKPNDVEINMGEKIIRSKILCYEDKFFFCGDEDIKILSNKGELLGTINDEPANGLACDNDSIFDISDGKLYTSVSIVEDETDSAKNEVYCCNIEDILNGNGEWEKAYTKNSWSEYWEEDPVWQVLQEEEGE